ncbi:hypothetical protein BC937DRAFT_90722 [Endogone sp. FLAS-F59071]|nr:hypothetical protein BC937DRAFT_90722 [Endogone sp. FLAS-F59071]|eukprot:RUS16859.1 hypothetical protein BC937DRAFT_90722 [Endogone sp. FLAS-F59071]
MPDPFVILPTEVSLRALSFLGPLSLARISSVSKLWYELTSLPDAWRSVCLSLYPDTFAVALTPTAGVVVADDELETLSKEYHRERLLIEKSTLSSYNVSILPPWTEMNLSEIRSLRLGLRENFIACCKDPKSFFTDTLFITKNIVPPSEFKHRSSTFNSLLRYGLAASTSDYQYGQVIGNTLKEDNWIGAVWSSTGSKNGKPEWLCFKMAEDLCLVRGVEVVPAKVRECSQSSVRGVGKSGGRAAGPGFVAIITSAVDWRWWISHYHEGPKDHHSLTDYIFAPKRIRFSFGFNDNPAQMHYHSRWFDMKCEYATQYFDLSPDLVVGGYLFITTDGNYTSHFNNLYYTAFRCVKAQGVCISLEDFQSTIDPNWPTFGEMRRTLQEWKKLMLKGLGCQDNVEQM